MAAFCAIKYSLRAFENLLSLTWKAGQTTAKAHAPLRFYFLESTTNILVCPSAVSFLILIGITLNL